MGWYDKMYTEDFIKKLDLLSKDSKQKEALQSTGSTIVLAGPGSGKTAVLTVKAAIILQEQAKPRGVACITYSQDASLEMRERLDSYGITDKRRLFVGTIHHFCIAEILKYAEIFSVRLPYPLKIASRKERENAFSIAKDMVDDSQSVSELQMNVERRNKAGSLSSVTPPSYDLALKVAIEYEKELHKNGVIDFEDIINYSVKLIQEQDYVRNALMAKYTWIFIDEYQDLGKPLHEIVLSLFYNTKINLFIVGDPDQSIYSFTGANPNYMNELLAIGSFYPIRLENNYRSPQKIVDASALVLGENRNYTGLTNKNAEFYFHECLDDWEEQFRYLATTIIPECDVAGINREEIGILIKGHKQIALCKQILQQYNISSYVSKMDFEKSTLINWVEKCAQWLCDHTSISLVSLMNEWCNNFNLDGHFDPLDGTSITRFAYQLENCDKSTLLNWINNMISTFNIEDNIIDDEKENLVNFIGAVQSDDFKCYDLSMFSKIGKPINQVVLSTWFAAKGLEFDAIILMGMDEGMMPDYKALDDEEILREQQRMCFVGVSRARKKCFLTRSNQYSIYSSRYHRYYSHDYQPSRFWNDLKARYGN